MSDLEKDNLDELEEDLVVVMTDEEGNEYYYREEMIIPVSGKQFAILVPLDLEEDCGCGDDACDCDEEACDCGDDGDDACDRNEETDVFIARIDIDENGEDVYVDPTDEEFEEVLKAYDVLMSEEEDDEA